MATLETFFEKETADKLQSYYDVSASIAKKVFNYGFIPLVLIIGMNKHDANTPRPSWFSLLLLM